MQCPQCHQENPPQANFCLACGVRLTLTCSACGTELPAGARFCLACGQPVQSPDTVQSHPAAPVAYTPKHLAEKILTSRSALEGERKQVTKSCQDAPLLAVGRNGILVRGFGGQIPPT